MVVYLKDMQKQDLFPHEKVHVHEQLEIKEFPCKTPRGGEGYTWYSIEQAKEDKNQVAHFKRTQRSDIQRGKMIESRVYRAFIGGIIKSRQRHKEINDKISSELRWWNSKEYAKDVCYVIMSNFYLEDRPTTVEELREHDFTSSPNLNILLRNAEAMGSIKIEKMKEDKRQKCVYPTAGLVVDTDQSFFWLTELLFEEWHEILGYQPSLEDFRKEFGNFWGLMMELVDDKMVTNNLNYDVRQKISQ